MPALSSPFAACRRPLFLLLPLSLRPLPRQYPGGHRSPHPSRNRARSSKARYSICIFKLESLYSRARVCVPVHVHARRRRHAKASSTTTIAIRHHHYHRRRRRRRRRRPPPPSSSRNPLLLLRLLLHLRRLSYSGRPLLAPSSSLAPPSSRPFFSASSSSSTSFTSSRASLPFFSVLCVLRARFPRRVHTRATAPVCVCVRRTLGGQGHTIHRNFKEIEGHSMHTVAV